MKRVVKRVFVRHIGEDYPLNIHVSENHHIEKSKSGHEIAKFIEYKFECTIDNISYSAESRDDASIAFDEFSKKLETHGFMLQCCGTCSHYYVDGETRKLFGGLCGYCWREKDTKRPQDKKSLRHSLQRCKKLVTKDTVDYAFSQEE